MLKKSSNKYGFSMAEMLIAIATLGVLAALITPALNGFSPDRNVAIFKKNYMNIERIVYELINDNEFYPEDINKKGLENTKAIEYEGTTYGSDDETSWDAKFKFPCLLKSRLNTVAEPGSNCEHFKTTDGVEWFVGYLVTEGSDKGKHTIILDIDGQDKGPNLRVCKAAPGTMCMFLESAFHTSGLSLNGTIKNIGLNDECPSDLDIYTLVISADGKISPVHSDSCEAEALKKKKLVK